MKVTAIYDKYNTKMVEASVSQLEDIELSLKVNDITEVELEKTITIGYTDTATGEENELLKLSKEESISLIKLLNDFHRNL